MDAVRLRVYDVRVLQTLQDAPALPRVPGLCVVDCILQEQRHPVVELDAAVLARPLELELVLVSRSLDVVREPHEAALGDACDWLVLVAREQMLLAEELVAELVPESEPLFADGPVCVLRIAQGLEVVVNRADDRVAQLLVPTFFQRVLVVDIAAFRLVFDFLSLALEPRDHDLFLVVARANVRFECRQSRLADEPTLAHLAKLQAKAPHQVHPTLALVQLGEADLEVDRPLAVFDELDGRSDVFLAAQGLVADCNVEEELRVEVGHVLLHRLVEEQRLGVVAGFAKHVAGLFEEIGILLNVRHVALGKEVVQMCLVR